MLGMLASLVALDAAAQEDIPRGNDRFLLVPHMDGAARAGVGAPIIDGAVEEAVWDFANASSNFWNSSRNRPPSNETEVRVIRDDEHLYLAFRLYDEQPDAIQATRFVRDGTLGYDDSITVELDTFFNRRDISTFALNPLGMQSDAIAGGRSAKIEWKGDWLGAARRTHYGWSAEFAIPFAILNYPEAATTFGVNFRRYQSRTREYSYWADITPQGLPERMGRLDGLALPTAREKKAWTLMPFVLAGRNLRDSHGQMERRLLTAGLDVRYQPRRDVTAVFAANPDFTQIEDAVTDISFSYAEKSVADNRPFFAEGADYFSSDDRYFYSNRVPDFDYGAKSFGRIGRVQFGLLGSRDAHDRSDFVGRSLVELGETSSVAATLVGTRRPGLDNTLAFAQLKGRRPSGFRYALDAAMTQTDGSAAPGVVRGDGRHHRGSVGWQGDHFYFDVTADRYGTAYFPANGLLDDALPGTEGRSAIAGYYRETSQQTWRVLDAYVGTTRRHTAAGERQRQKVFAGVSLELANDTRVALYLDEGPYRPVSETRGTFAAHVNEDRYYSVAVDFNVRSNRSSGGFRYDRGHLGGEPYQYFSAHAWWRPTNSVALSVSGERTESFGVREQVMIGSSWDLAPEHSLSGRYIHTESDGFYRLAYSHRARQGLDIFLVYDGRRSDADELSVKAVQAF
jgi:hypothetical protein